VDGRCSSHKTRPQNLLEVFNIAINNVLTFFENLQIELLDGHLPSNFKIGYSEISESERDPRLRYATPSDWPVCRGEALSTLEALARANPYRSPHGPPVIALMPVLWPGPEVRLGQPVAYGGKVDEGYTSSISPKIV
jgi:hypothetical protein